MRMQPVEVDKSRVELTSYMMAACNMRLLAGRFARHFGHSAGSSVREWNWSERKSVRNSGAV